MPEISVLTSVYNCEDYLGEFLESILNQTFKDFELVIINDGSTDKSREIIESYKDKRIRLFNFDKNQGIPKALNFGIDKCNGKYIAKADADDIYRMDRLEKQKKMLDEHPEISVVGSQVEYFPHDEDAESGLKFISKKMYFEKQINSIIDTVDIKEKMYMFLCLIHSVMMIRNTVLKNNLYDEDYLRLGEDYKLLYDLNKQSYNMYNIPEKLGHIRIRKESTSVLNKDALFEAFFNIKKEEVVKMFDKPVYIWGASNYGIGLKNVMQKNGFKINGFIDNDKNKIGNNLDGLTIYSPNILGKKREKVISASDPGRFEIVDYLKKLGYEHLKDFVVF